MNISAVAIFDKSPGSWGLRGDPYLWNDLKEHFAAFSIPFPEEDFIREMGRAFETITGGKMEEKDFIHVSQYEHGGMSSGMVSPEFWQNTALPLLIERLRVLNQTGRD